MNFENAVHTNAMDVLTNTTNSPKNLFQKMKVALSKVYIQNVNMQ